MAESHKDKVDQGRMAWKRSELQDGGNGTSSPIEIEKIFFNPQLNC